MLARQAAIFDTNDPGSPLSVPATNTALLLLDFHNAIVMGLGDQALDATTRAKNMRDWANSNKVSVVHALVDLQQDARPFFKFSQWLKETAAAILAEPHAIDEHQHVAFNADAPADEHQFKRTPGYISALKSQGLPDFLSRREIRSLLLCGLSTSGCLLSTARSAGDEGYIVTVIEDACHDPAPGLHESLVKHVLPAAAHVATAEEFQREWSRVRV